MSANCEKTKKKRHWAGLLTGILVLIFCLTGCNIQDMKSIPIQASVGENVSQREAGEKALQDKEQEGLETSGKDRQGQVRETEGELKVTYLDVGQGNAVLAESQGHFMLIDGGARETSSFVVSYLKNHGIEKLDYILISHFDEDHLAGAVGVLHTIPTGLVISPDYTADSAIYSSYREALKEKGYEPVHPEIGEEFPLGTSGFRIISPVSYGHKDENQDSVGIVLENGENKFFIGGDIGLEGEEEILEQGIDVQADVCLMNHHGSHVSREFFQAVNPSYAVISCGADNSYGHPRQDTVELIEDFQVPLFRTDLQGTVTAISDGEQIVFEQEPCGDYTPGAKKNGQEGEEPSKFLSNSDLKSCDYVLNLHTKKIHRPDCGSLESMKEKNKGYFKGDKGELLDHGYTVCGSCRP